MKKRISYSKDFKYSALIRVINGENFEDVLRSSGFNIDNLIKKDKKYCPKLLHKWKKEIYENPELIYFINNEISNNEIEAQIEILSKNCKDIINDDLKLKMLYGAKKYRDLKKHILSIYCKNK